MQLQTFKVITLGTETPTASSDVDIHLEPKLLEASLKKIKYIHKLGEALHYIDLTLIVAKWILTLTCGTGSAARELLPTWWPLRLAK